jgi:hypothetical protein
MVRCEHIGANFNADLYMRAVNKRQGGEANHVDKDE